MPVALRLRRLHVVAWSALAVAVAILVVLSVRAYLHHAAVQRMTAEFDQLGARVMIAGYADGARWPRLPVFVNHILSHRSQAEVFLYDAATAEQVLAAVERYPQVRRIWVNLNVFDRSKKTEIQQRMPGMDVVMYTPGPNMK